MDRKDEKIIAALKSEGDTYPCVWYRQIICPIRTQWKLKPENLAPWCNTCKQIGYLDEQKKKLEKGGE